MSGVLEREISTRAGTATEAEEGLVQSANGRSSKGARFNSYLIGSEASPGDSAV